MQIVALATILSACVAQVVAHGKLTSPLGLNVNPAVALDSQRDVALGVSKRNACGRVLGGGANAIDRTDTTPRATFQAGSSADIVYRIVNQDGAGPLTVSFSPDNGQTWTDAEVTTNAPGRGGINLANLRGGADATVTFNVPNMECPEGSCLMQVRNPISFGSCAPVAVGAALTNNIVKDFANSGGAAAPAAAAKGAGRGRKAGAGAARAGGARTGAAGAAAPAGGNAGGIAARIKAIAAKANGGAAGAGAAGAGAAKKAAGAAGGLRAKLAGARKAGGAKAKQAAA
ncbi:uncharacterized protein EV422DRAFT_536737 [Fimicolochytrium jonesii]|uniref:uncharacterized protein n=1 Tax=Fimicolochytrium jonesii TaxID=1396493 RepID=UPI0022FF43B8|nr:uncharacterized protein EV422DRAFT_536737 [Fimicolochytrium jonesii]KAI8818761.1 hypothetical protein EV422DRAFT_536737 [Fimicolochytrium jonesii]